MSAAARTPIAGYEHVLEPGTTGWTLLLLHGTGGDEHDLVPLGRQLAPGAALLSPRGTVLENGVTNRFFARRTPVDIDVPDMLRRSDELAAFVAEAAAAYQLDPARIVAVGYSNGANIALTTLLRHPGVLRGGALLRPVIYDEPSPLPDLSGTDVLAVAGARDPFSPPEAIDRMRDVFSRAHARLQLIVDPTGGHGLGPDDLMRTATWLDGVLAS